MPKLYRVGQYIIFFWSNENNEPIHVHVGIVNPAPNTTKIWITQSGGCLDKLNFTVDGHSEY